MGRKTDIYTVAEEGRDFGKKFYLTEMSPAKTERWAMRAFMALAKANVDLGPDVMSGGMQSLARVGLTGLARADFRDVEPLLAEMLECVEFIYEPRKIELRRALTEDDIEEVGTLMRLRMEVFKLHVNFSKAAD